MNENQTKKSFLRFPFLNKLKSIKHLELVIALILVGVLILVYFGSFSSTGTSPSKTSTQISYTNASTYARETEEKLSSIISQIDGVQSAEVMIVLSSSSELIIAKTTNEVHKTETATNGTVTENSTKDETPLLTNGEPLILLEILPKVAGVVVVAKGANDTTVKLNILKAIQALLSVPSGNIEIIEGK